MKLRSLMLVAISVVWSPAHGQYKEGWTTRAFYEAVHLCRSAILYPAAQDYEAAGLKRGQTRLAMRNEVIANTPLFETIANDVCYCAVNQYAKDYVFSDIKVRKGDFSEYISTPDCKSKMTKALDAVKANPRAHTLP